VLNAGSVTVDGMEFLESHNIKTFSINVKNMFQWKRCVFLVYSHISFIVWKTIAYRFYVRDLHLFQFNLISVQFKII
jgi:hypothetical protein